MKKTLLSLTLAALMMGGASTVHAMGWVGLNYLVDLYDAEQARINEYYPQKALECTQLITRTISFEGRNYNITPVAPLTAALLAPAILNQTNIPVLVHITIQEEPGFNHDTQIILPPPCTRRPLLRLEDRLLILYLREDFETIVTQILNQAVDQANTAFFFDHIKNAGSSNQ